MDKFKSIFFGIFVMFVFVVISNMIAGGDTISTIIGFIGGVGFLYSVIKFDWLKKIKAYK